MDGLPSGLHGIADIGRVTGVPLSMAINIFWFTTVFPKQQPPIREKKTRDPLSSKGALTEKSFETTGLR